MRRHIFKAYARAYTEKYPLMGNPAACFDHSNWLLISIIDKTRSVACNRQLRTSREISTRPYSSMAELMYVLLRKSLNYTQKFLIRRLKHNNFNSQNQIKILTFCVNW